MGEVDPQSCERKSYWGSILIDEQRMLLVPSENFENNWLSSYGLIGMLPLTFDDPSDYDKIKSTDRISLLGLKEFAPGKSITCEVTHQDGTKEQFPLNHSYNESQIEWFKAGSALNNMAKMKN